MMNWQQKRDAGLSSMCQIFNLLTFIKYYPLNVLLYIYYYLHLSKGNYTKVYLQCETRYEQKPVINL